MMLKTTEITTASGPRAITAHVFHGRDNDEILVLTGCEADVEDFFDDARFHRNRGGVRAGQHALHAVRHVIIAPEIATSREQGEAVARSWCAEFNVPFDRCAFVEHRKPRADDNAWDRHWHLLAPGVVGGRVVDNRNFKRRNEKLARLAEITLGHRLIKGRHNQAVYCTLMNQGLRAEAAAMEHLIHGAPALASYTANGHQTAKRMGLSMPHTKASATTAAARSWDQADGGQAFVAAMAAQGIRIRPGTKAGIFLFEARNRVGEWGQVGAVHRMLKRPAGEVVARLLGIDLEAAFAAAVAVAPAIGTEPGEDHHDDAYTLPSLNQPYQASDPPIGIDGPAAVDLGPRAGGLVGHHGSGGGQGTGPAGPLGPDLRGHAGGASGGLATPTAGPARGSLPGPADHRVADGDRGGAGPDRAAALRNRILVGQLDSALRRSGTQRAIDDLTARLRAGPGQPAAITAYAIRQGATAGDLAADREQRRVRWIATQLRQHYDTGWLPVSVADRIARIKIDEQSATVILTLKSAPN